MTRKQHGWLVSIYISTQPEAIDTQFFKSEAEAERFRRESLIEVEDVENVTMDEVVYNYSTGEYEAA